MRVRSLLLLTALWAGAGLVAALPARATTQVQQCRLVAGRLVLSPGLSDVPTSQTIIAHGRLAGCSAGGGSGTFAATILTTPVTCASLGSGLLPADVAFGWADGETMIAALAFSPPPASPNKVELAGTVVSGTAPGTRVDGGLRMSVLYPPAAIKSHGHTANVRVRQQHLPLASTANACSVKSPITTIDLDNFEGLALATPKVRVASPSASRPIGSRSKKRVAHTITTPVTAATTTTTAAPVTVPRRMITRPRVAPAKPKRRVAVASLAGPPPSGSTALATPESVLGAGVAIGSLCGIGLLSIRRARLPRVRTARRVVR